MNRRFLRILAVMTLLLIWLSPRPVLSQTQPSPTVLLRHWQLLAKNLCRRADVRLLPCARRHTGVIAVVAQTHLVVRY